MSFNRVDFERGIKLIHNIDAQEIGNPSWYPQFRDNPVEFYLRADDLKQLAIFEAMLARVNYQLDPAPSSEHFGRSPTGYEN